MDRRTYLRSLGVAGVAATAGCLDGVASLLDDGSADGAILGPPEVDLSAASHPSYGDDVPSFSLPDPLLEEEISPERFAGERAFLLTFIYTNCHDDSCPMLLSRLVHAQQAAAEEGLEDEVALLAMTFDPERDTADVLREEAEIVGADLETGNWHFLRPESYDEAETVLAEQFGLQLDHHGLDDHDHGHDDHDHEHGNDDHEHGNDADEYDITHYNLILLVNRDGIVERAYPNAASVEWSVITDDLLTVVEDG